MIIKCNWFYGYLNDITKLKWKRREQWTKEKRAEAEKELKDRLLVQQNKLVMGEMLGNSASLRQPLNNIRF